MRICIDATPVGMKTNDKGGVYRYVGELIRALGRIDGENQYTLFFNVFRRSLLIEDLAGIAGRMGLPGRFSIRLSRFPPRIRKLLEPPVELFSGAFDVFHGCFDYLPPTLSGKMVVTIHDIRYLDPAFLPWQEDSFGTFPCELPPGEGILDDYSRQTGLFRHLRKTLGRTIRRANRVITVSEYSRKRMMDLLGVPPGKIRVVPHGVNPAILAGAGPDRATVLSRYGIQKPFLLHVGKFDPGKNLLRLLEAFRDLASHYNLRLVLAGPDNWYSSLLKGKLESMGLAGKVVFTGFVPDDHLAVLYREASVFVFPSLYEGFGIPLLEAMACGVPAVASTACSIPEVAGDAAVLVDPSSAECIAQGIVSVLEDNGLRRELIRKGRARAGTFSWERAARETVKVYAEAAGGG